MRRVGHGLLSIRRHLGPERWRPFAASGGIRALRDVLRADPFTRRALEKPRGYPGDAVLLDMACGSRALPEDVSDLGAAVHAYTTGGAAGTAPRLAA